MMTNMFAGSYAVEYPATALADGSAAPQAASEPCKGTFTIGPP